MNPYQWKLQHLKQDPRKILSSQHKARTKIHPRIVYHQQNETIQSHPSNQTTPVKPKLSYDVVVPGHFIKKPI